MKWKGVEVSLYPFMYNMYAPHRIVRRTLHHIIYKWADKKYGVSSRSGKYPLTAEDEAILTKWHKWMDFKNKVNNRI